MLATIWIRLPQVDSRINDRLGVHFYSVAFLAFMSVAGIPSFVRSSSFLSLRHADPDTSISSSRNVPYFCGNEATDYTHPPRIREWLLQQLCRCSNYYPSRIASALTPIPYLFICSLLFTVIMYASHPSFKSFYSPCFAPKILVHRIKLKRWQSSDEVYLGAVLSHLCSRVAGDIFLMPLS